MPSNASANCCTSRNPPSPEGLAPRLAISPPTPQRILSASKESLFSPKDSRQPIFSWGKAVSPQTSIQQSLSVPDNPSWGTAVSAKIGAELRAIFEEDKSEAEVETPGPKAKITPKLRALLGSISDTANKPEVKVKKSRSAKLRALLEGDDSEHEYEHQRIQAKQSSSTLSVVKNKLKKALPGELIVSKRHSRSSVGTSEEEIERRAELRRIRQKRIQDELSNEGIYDEDAKSLSTVTGAADSSLGKKSRNPWLAGDFLPLPHLSPLALALPAYPFPKLSSLQEQHDALRQAGIYDLSSVEPSPRPRSEGENMFFIDSRTSVTSRSTISRRHSSPILAEFEITPASDMQVYRLVRKRSSIPPIPPAPVLRPKRLSSIVDPAKSSWRLSFSADKRANHLRKLSQGAAIPITLLTELQPGVALPPINRWMHSQGLRSTSQAITSTEDSIILESTASHSQTCSASQDFGGVDGAEDGSAALHLHEMGISQRLASRGIHSSCSSPQLSSWGSRSHQRGLSSISGASRVTDNGRARYLRNTSDSVPLSQRVPPTWGKVLEGGKVLEDGTSSFYPSARNSIQPSPQSSRFNLLSLMVESKDKVDIVRSTGIEESDVNETITPLTGSSLANLSTGSLPLPHDRYTRRTTIDDSSIVVSETESFREREAELSMVKKRFAATEAQRCPSTPRSSKFREEFDFKSPVSEVSTPSKTSALARLARLASRSYDGAAGIEELLGVPLLDVTPGALPHSGTGISPGMLSPSGKDDISNIWGKAVKRAADAKSKDVASNLHIPDKKHGKGNSRKKSQISQDSKGKGGFHFPRTLSWRKKGKDKDNGASAEEMEAHEKAAAVYQKRFEERMAAKEMVMDSWEAELEATAQKAKAKSRNIMRKIRPSGPDRRYPASWSKFPSHARSERTFSAAKDDGVEKRHFAIKELSANGEPVWYHSERKHHLYHHDDDDHESHQNGHPDTLLGKIQVKIGEKMYELETSSDQVLPESTSGRRSSMNLAGSLEYPELEIIPLREGIITQAQLEHRIDAELKDDVREKRKQMVARAALDGSVDIVSEDDEDVYEELELSIADPRFYDDCINNLALEDKDKNGGDSDGVEEMQPISERKEKFKTWSGRDWDGYKYGRSATNRRRNVSLGTMVLRHSTDEFRCEVERMEKVEMERLLKAAEAAWGIRSG